MLAGLHEFASDGGVHLMIVVKHRRRAQELQCPHRGVSEDVEHGDPFPADSNLDEDHAHLRQRRVSERCFRIRAGPADDGAVYGRRSRRSAITRAEASPDWASIG